MIDSVLKGTGNSRFLKSAVPAGTSWADALAMLHSGTFPIDFNGINTEGFQQVGTPLNKANLLKDATAAQIGLPPSTTPDGMFQALGNTGELHVWRKTAGTTTTYPVSTNPNAYQEGSDAKPAGYTLGEVVSGNFQFGYPYSSNTGFRMDASASVSVDDNGNVSLAAPITSKTINKANVNSKAEIEQLMLGKYVIADKYTYPHSDDIPGGIVIYIPSDATINMDPDAGSWRLSKYQPVTGYAAIPAGTTIEYLGKLGDKARVQVVSYVGTGTYGESNKNSLTFNFLPRVLLIAMSGKYNSRIYTGILYPFSECGIYLAAGSGGGISELKCSKSNHEIFWWSSENNQKQLNISGYKYTAIAIG